MNKSVDVYLGMSVEFAKEGEEETQTIDLEFEGDYAHYPQTYWDPEDHDIELELEESSFNSVVELMKDGWFPEDYKGDKNILVQVTQYLEDNAIDMFLTDPSSYIGDW